MYQWDQSTASYMYEKKIKSKQRIKVNKKN